MGKLTACGGIPVSCALSQAGVRIRTMPPDWVVVRQVSQVVAVPLAVMSKWYFKVIVARPGAKCLRLR